MQKQMKTLKNDARTAEIQFKIRQYTSEGADFLYTYELNACGHDVDDRWAWQGDPQ